MSSIHPIGFTKLGEDGTQKQPPCFNIIFVHGLKGHPERTWGRETVEAATLLEKPNRRHKNRIKSLFGHRRPGSPSGPSNRAPSSAPRTQPFWPKEFLVHDIPDATVWTYGYNAGVTEGGFEAYNKNNISQHGRDLVAKLTREIDNDDPIVFIAHSLGGIIVKDAIRRSEPCQLRTKLIIFLGTPHRGSVSAGWGTIASNLARLALYDSNNTIIRGLELDSEVLDNIQEEFKSIVNKYRFQIHSFQEARGMSGVTGLSGKVVDDFSSKVDFAREIETVESIDADHRQMVKCTDRDDPRYRAILGVLKRFMRLKSPEIMPELHTTKSNQVVFCVPFSANSRFVGRDEILKKLNTLLFADRGHPTILRKAALVGLGGIGKSQIALQLAYWVKESHPDYSVFWVSVLSKASFEQSYRQIMKDCEVKRTDEENPKILVQEHLNSKEAGKWLLVVDNADDMDVVRGSDGSADGIYNYLPKSTQGVILFTTRSRKIAVSVAMSNVIQVPEMDAEEAKDYLEKALIDKNLIQDKGPTTKLLSSLTHLPLAITQAAAYINENVISVGEYLELFEDTQEDRVGLMSSPFSDDTRYEESENAVASTWLVSFDQVRKTEPFAAKLLTYFSYLEPKGVPQSILPEASNQDMVRAIGTLTGYGFLSRREDKKTFDMHSLVHTVTDKWSQKQGNIGFTVADAVSRLCTVFPSSEWENRELWRQYLPHVLKVLGRSYEFGQKECELGYLTSRCLYVDGRIPEAVKLLEHVVAIRHERLAEDHPDQLASQHELAGAYRANGKVKEAVKLLEHVVAIRYERLAEDHPDQLASQHNLAKAYNANGQVKEAVRLLEHVVAIRRKILAEDHRDRLTSQHELAGAYLANGQVEEAVKLLENIVKIEEKLAENHPDRLASQHELAGAYRANGKVKEAVKLLEHVVAIHNEILAEDHPDRLTSQHELARAYRANWQVEKAVKLLENVVEIEEKLAEDHPDRLASQHELARAYHANWQVEKAVKLLENVVEIEEKLAEDHPDRLASQHSLARAYHANGQVEEAVKLLEYVVAIRSKILTEDHPDRLASQHELARAYHANGQVEEAVKLLEHVVKVQKKILAEDHPRRLKSEKLLAFVTAELE